MHDLQEKLSKETERKLKLEKQIEEEKQGREASEERDLILSQLKEQENISKELNKELDKYKENDPVLFETKGKIYCFLTLL